MKHTTTGNLSGVTGVDTLFLLLLRIYHINNSLILRNLDKPRITGLHPLSISWEY